MCVKRAMSRTVSIYWDIFLHFSGRSDDNAVWILPSSKLLTLGEGWVCPWPVVTDISSISLFFHSTFGLASRLIRFSGSNWGPLEYLCVILKPCLVCECLHSVHLHLTSTSWVPHSLPPHPPARGRALVCARTNAKLCVSDSQHHALFLVPGRVPACTHCTTKPVCS